MISPASLLPINRQAVAANGNARLALLGMIAETQAAADDLETAADDLASHSKVLLDVRSMVSTLPHSHSELAGVETANLISALDAARVATAACQQRIDEANAQLIKAIDAVRGVARETRNRGGLTFDAKPQGDSAPS